MKNTKCILCGNPLTGKKTKFCSNSCYIEFKTEQAKNFRLKIRKRIPERNCSLCNKKFQPFREDNINCSRICSKQYWKEALQAKRSAKKKTPRVRPMDPVKPFTVKPSSPLKIKYTAEQLGADPETVLRQYVRGEIPLAQMGADQQSRYGGLLA